MAPDPRPTLYRNRLLRLLSPADLGLLTEHFVYERLEERHNFESPNRPVSFVYFIEAGLGSLIARTTNGDQVEVGVIGRDGMTGQMVVMGNDRSPHECFMQVAGEGHRVPADQLQSAMERSATLRPLLLRYVQTFTIQAAHTALANARGKLEERLARWLLMAHDRLDGDELALKHDFLALMLGVHRPGVTVALHALEKRGAIATKRGCIVIHDRAGLKAMANGLYGTPEAEYKRLMGVRT
jgi:CRP-like cAMP-binding protein